MAGPSPAMTGLELGSRLRGNDTATKGTGEFAAAFALAKLSGGYHALPDGRAHRHPPDRARPLRYRQFRLKLRHAADRELERAQREARRREGRGAQGSARGDRAGRPAERASGSRDEVMVRASALWMRGRFAVSPPPTLVMPRSARVSTI